MGTLHQNRYILAAGILSEDVNIFSTILHRIGGPQLMKRVSSVFSGIVFLTFSSLINPSKPSQPSVIDLSTEK